MLSLQPLNPKMASNYYEKEDYYSKDSIDMKPKFYGKLASEFELDKNEFNMETFKNLIRGKFEDGTDILNRPKRFIKEDDIKPILDVLKKEQFKENREKIVNKIGKEIFGDQKNFFNEKANKYFNSDENNSNKILSEIASKGILQGTIEDQDILNKYLNKQIPCKIDRNFLKESFHLICKDKRRSGIDATFSAPKKISIKALVEGDNKLLKAHKEAVEWSLKQIESNAIFTRTGSRENRKEVKTDNILSAVFHHGTARETKNNAPDPQLHSHCVLFNFTKYEGKFRHFHSDELYRTAKLLGVLYQNKLAENVQKTGHEIELKDNGTFDLVGYNDATIDQFSKRGRQTNTQSAKIIFLGELEDSLKQNGFNILTGPGKFNSNIKVKANKKKLENSGYKVDKWKKGIAWISDFKGKNSYENSKKYYQDKVTTKDRSGANFSTIW